MTKSNIRTYIITLALTLLPILAGAIFYSRLPDQMPLHFNLENQPDLLAPKPFVLFGLPAIMALAQALVLTLFFTVTKKIEKKPKILSVVTWIVPTLTLFLSTLLLVYSLGNAINIGRYVLLFIGLLLAILGNYLPKSSYTDMRDYVHPRPRNEKSFRYMIRFASYALLALSLTFLILAWLV